MPPSRQPHGVNASPPPDGMINASESLGASVCMLLVTDEPSAARADRPNVWRIRQQGRRELGAPLIRITGEVEGALSVSGWDDLGAQALQYGASVVLLAFPASPAELRVAADRVTSFRLQAAVVVNDSGVSGLDVPHHGSPYHCRALEVPPGRYAIPDSSAAPGHWLRRAAEVAGVIVLGVVCLPLVAVALVAIPIESAGPPVFSQIRAGEGGRPFRIWKFRTMYRSATPNARSPSDDDPRVTRIGRIIRPTGLDELPQLVNILLGHMSLVGPRPEMMYLVDRYTNEQRARLGARPGLTGVWQLCGDRGAPMHEQLEFDMFQIAFRSHRLDAVLLGGTVVYALRRMLSVIFPASRTMQQ